jgi:hypothetical protein
MFHARHLTIVRNTYMQRKTPSMPYTNSFSLSSKYQRPYNTWNFRFLIGLLTAHLKSTVNSFCCSNQKHTPSIFTWLITAHLKSTCWRKWGLIRSFTWFNSQGAGLPLASLARSPPSLALLPRSCDPFWYMIPTEKIKSNPWKSLRSWSWVGDFWEGPYATCVMWGLDQGLKKKGD